MDGVSKEGPVGRLLENVLSDGQGANNTLIVGFCVDFQKQFVTMTNTGHFYDSQLEIFRAPPNLG